MTVRLPLVVLCVLIGSCATPPSPRSAYSYVTVAPDAPSETAIEVLELFMSQEFSLAIDYFDQSVREHLTNEVLMKVWEVVNRMLGELQGILLIKRTDRQGSAAVVVTCEFARKIGDFILLFNEDEKAVGIFFENPRNIADRYSAAPYVSRASFEEFDMEITTGEWTLPGTLTIPTGEGRVPAIILVHGSGANDRDETVGPNLPFRDLAWGLASRGLAVLRYEKRTR